MRVCDVTYDDYCVVTLQFCSGVASLGLLASCTDLALIHLCGKSEAINRLRCCFLDWRNVNEHQTLAAAGE
eukprot:m.80994 g.80994  ORF g.80994 m.80994 type:complete len:71 (-) comp12620_c0_seq6:2131-2343(-)